MSLDTVISLLEAHPYLFLFALVMVEGPMVTICAGFLAAAGIVNFPLAYMIAVVADLSGDSLYYLLGHSGRNPKVRRFLERVGLNERRMSVLERALAKHGSKTLVGAKVFDVAAAPVFVAAGFARTGYGKFMALTTIMTLPKTALLLALGFFFGTQAVRYLDFGPAVFVVVALVLGVYLYISKHLSRERERSQPLEKETHT